MAFGTPSDQKFSDLSTITGSGSTVTGIDLVGDCAGNPGSPSDISLWDDFIAAGPSFSGLPGRQATTTSYYY